MKVKHKKWVFIGVIGAMILFIGGYYLFLLREDQGSKGTQETKVPELKQEIPQYTERKEAVDYRKEERQRTAPSVYEEDYFDSLGRYDTTLLNKRKQRIVDSIYALGRIEYSSVVYQDSLENQRPLVPLSKDWILTEKVSQVKRRQRKKDVKAEHKTKVIDLQKEALNQQLFFASEPVSNIKVDSSSLEVVVEGTQVIRTHDRLKLRTLTEGFINGQLISRNTVLYGVVSFKPNRVLLSISNIDHKPIKLLAYDYDDGLEGVYIQNSFRAEASREVLGDMVEDISVPGIPQVKGIKKVFQRSNRNVKVTVLDGYRLLLK